MATGSFKLPISSGGSGVTPWVRPSDWLPMPTVTAANDTFVALTAVFPEGQNWVAFLFTTSAGQYQVDWGDGTVTLHNSNTVAQYEYNYATISNSTLTSRGYKQAIITVTAVSGLLRTIDIRRRFATSPAQSTSTSSPYLDIILSMPNATGMLFGAESAFPNRYCERVQVLAIGTTTNLSNFFRDFSRMQSVSLPNTSGVTNMSGLFHNCSLIQEVPFFQTSQIGFTASLFANCSSLKIVPLIDTSNFTSMDSMFIGCVSLESVPFFNTINVTNMNSMFNGCRSLKSVPLFNTANVIRMNGMFTNCAFLKSVPLFNTIKVTDFSSMFLLCGSLTEVPSFNTIAATKMDGMFNQCGVMLPPTFDTQNVTNMNTMFSNAVRLQLAPSFNTINVNDMTNMFNNCTVLQSIPSYDVSAITTTAMGNFAQGCVNVDRIQTVFKTTVNIQNCQLSRTALVEVFNNLLNRSATTSATITITTNWGATNLTVGERLIATTKNWVIVG